MARDSRFSRRCALPVKCTSAKVAGGMVTSNTSVVTSSWLYSLQTCNSIIGPHSHQRTSASILLLFFHKKNPRVKRKFISDTR